MWSAIDISSGLAVSIVLRPPKILVEQIKHVPLEGLHRLSHHPLLLHLLMLQHVRRSHWQASVALAKGLTREVRYVDAGPASDMYVLTFDLRGFRKIHRDMALQPILGEPKATSLSVDF